MFALLVRNMLGDAHAVAAATSPISLRKATVLVSRRRRSSDRDLVRETRSRLKRHRDIPQQNTEQRKTNTTNKKGTHPTHTHIIRKQ